MAEEISPALLAAADQGYAAIQAGLDRLVAGVRRRLLVEPPMEAAGRLAFVAQENYDLRLAAQVLAAAVVRLAEGPPPRNSPDPEPRRRPLMTHVSPATSAPSTTGEVLLRAVEMLERHGWRQHHAGQPDGPGLGITGAIAAAVAGRPVDVLDGRGQLELYQRARQACLAELRRDQLEWDIWLALWNDRPGRTVGEVQALLRAAAARAQARS